MKIDGASYASYVEKVRHETQRYVQDLLQENAQLRRHVACLQSDKESLLKDKSDLEEQFATLRKALDRHQQEQENLRQKLKDIEAENQRFSDRYAEVEAQNNNLANLYVASYRLHGTLDRHEVLEAIKEIVINLIGSEELAIFEMSREGTVLELADSFGLETGTYQSIPVGTGIIGRVAAIGETYVAGQSDDAPRVSQEEHLTACIPLRVDDRVRGAVAVFRLLPQKTSGLGALDHELFELLATQAATALYSTSLRAMVATQATDPRSPSPPCR